MFYNQCLIILTCLGFVTQLSWAQSSLDIHFRLAKMGSDSARVIYLKQQIDSLYRLEPERALTYANLADSLLESTEDIANQLKLKATRAVILREMGRLKDAQEVLQVALANFPIENASRTVALARAQIHTGLAIIYRRRGNLPASVAESQRAIRQLDSLIQLQPNKENYLKQQSDAYTGLAITYARSENYPLSNEYFRRSLSLDQRIDNVQEVDGTLFNLASNFYKTEQYDSAEFYWNSVISRTDTTADSPMLDAIYQNLGALATIQEQWNKAERYYRQALQRYQQRGNQEGTASLYESLSNLYNQQERYELAQQQAKKGLEAIDENLRIRSLLHSDLAEAYEGLTQYQLATESYRAYAILRDSLLGQEKAEAIAEMEARYQNEQQEKELAIQDQEIELLNQRSQIQQLERNLLAAGLLLLLLVGFFVIRMQRHKVKRKQTQLKNSQALLASVKENAYLKEQRLLQELEHRDQQLTSYTLNFVQKNELMSNLRQQIDELQKQKQWTSRDFRRIKMHIQQHVSIDQDWENFRLHFESVHPDFFHNLAASFANLGSKELRLCALLRLNMSIKESATVLGISPDSVKTARHRLRKKMNLDNATSLLEALMQIEKGKAPAKWPKAS